MPGSVRAATIGLSRGPQTVPVAGSRSCAGGGGSRRGDIVRLKSPGDVQPLGVVVGEAGAGLRLNFGIEPDTLDGCVAEITPEERGGVEIITIPPEDRRPPRPE